MLITNRKYKLAVVAKSTNWGLKNLAVSHAVSAADLLFNDIAYLAILWSKFVDLGNLSILTLLEDLLDWKKFFFSGHEF